MSTSAVNNTAAATAPATGTSTVAATTDSKSRKVDEFNLPKIYGLLPSNKYTNSANAFIASTALWLYMVFYAIRKRLRLYYYRAMWRKYNLHTPTEIRPTVSKLPKIPKHAGFILNYQALGGFKQLVEASTELCSWALGAGSPVLTIYERTGALKREDLQSLADAFASGLRANYGRQSVPHIVVRKNEQYVEAGDVGTTALTVQLMSEADGKPFVAALAKEFGTEMANGTLKETDITIDLIHQLHLKRIGDEPDLLVTFNSYLDLEGFSPWLSRICELHCVPDNGETFNYFVFLDALRSFADVKVNLGS